MAKPAQLLIDEKYMRRALLLARRGTGWVNPNPMVGAVVVKNNVIIGEGFHEHFGAPHAEVNAIREAGRKVAGSTLYVTLEPCSHHGKTPPCTDLIIQSEIKRVVVAMMDPNPLVNGSGIDKLKENGIEVISGIYEAEAMKLNEVFIRYITTGKAFGVLKTAMTLDGKIATVTNASRWISGDVSRAFVHDLRHALSAVMVGINTVLYDDPLLNIRRTPESRNPLKVIVDTHGKTPKESKVMQVNPQLTLIATTANADQNKLKDLERLGAQILICPVKNEKVDLVFLFEALGNMGIDSVLIEGGSTLAFSLLQEGLINKVISFIAPKIIGGREALTPVGGEGIHSMEDAIQIKDWSYRRIGDDLLIEGYIN